MKKTRFEKFMLAVTKKALKEESLDTYEDHLKYARLSIEFELLKNGGKTKKAKKKAGAGKIDQISRALGTIKSGLSWSWSGSKKIYNFLITGNNFVILLVGSLLLYVAIAELAWLWR